MEGRGDRMEGQKDGGRERWRDREMERWDPVTLMKTNKLNIVTFIPSFMKHR